VSGYPFVQRVMPDCRYLHPSDSDSKDRLLSPDSLWGMRLRPMDDDSGLLFHPVGLHFLSPGDVRNATCQPGPSNTDVPRFGPDHELKTRCGCGPAVLSVED